MDVLLVPVGGGGSLTSAQASEAIGLFEPGVVVPMRYRIPGLEEDLDGVDAFLREMGIEEADTRETLTVSEPSTSEETDIYVLEASLS